MAISSSWVILVWLFMLLVYRVRGQDRGVEWTVPPLSQDLEVVEDLAVLPDLGIGELISEHVEQALRLCPGINRDRLVGVRGNEDGEAGHGLVRFDALSIEHQGGSGRVGGQ